MRFLLLFSLILFTSYLKAQSWQQLTDFPGSPRDDAAGFNINDKYYCGTGRDDGFNCTRDFYKFNGTTQVWESATPLPVGENRQYATGFAYDGNGYILCGNNCSTGYLNSFWKFDSSSEQWTPLPALPASGRAGCVHFIIGDSLYLVGGQNTNGILNEVWRYCFTTQEWVQKSNLPIPGIWRGLAFSYANSGYIGAGKTLSNAWNYQTLEYDPTIDNWSDFSILNFGARTYVGTVQRDSCLYIFGGLDSLNQTLTLFEKVNLNDYTNQILPSFSSTPRKGIFCFAHNSDFYITTGISGNTRLKETWKLDNVMEILPSTFSNLIIYPMPTSDLFTFEVEPVDIGKEIILKDNFGKTVLISSINSAKNQISIAHLPSGVYHLTNGKQDRKIIKID